MFINLKKVHSLVKEYTYVYLLKGIKFGVSTPIILYEEKQFPFFDFLRKPIA